SCFVRNRLLMLRQLSRLALLHYFRGQHDAFIADEYVGAFHEHLHFALSLAAKRTISRVVRTTRNERLRRLSRHGAQLVSLLANLAHGLLQLPVGSTRYAVYGLIIERPTELLAERIQ